MLENKTLVRQLKVMRFSVGAAAIREDGIPLIRVNDVFGFRPDAVDLAIGDATLAKVLARNKCEVFPNAPGRQMQCHTRRAEDAEKKFGPKFLTKKVPG
jgi:hypothetical protein